MASLVLGVAGAAIGSFFGAPQVGFSIGSALGSAMSRPHVNGPRLSDLKVQASQYGQLIPIVYNIGRASGQMIWADKLIEHKNEEDSGSGGGGYTEYTYTCSFAIGIAEGPHSVRKVWADGKIIYDADIGLTHFKGTSLTFYPGNEVQLPDPTIESILGIGNVPAYRGLCYCVFTDLELGKYGNKVPNFTFELADAETPQVWEVVDKISPLLGYHGPLVKPTYWLYTANTAYIESSKKVWKFVYYGTPINPPGNIAILDPDTDLSVVGFTDEPDHLTYVIYGLNDPPADPVAAAQVTFGSASFSPYDPSITYLVADYFLVGTNPTEAWTGHANTLAKWSGGQWIFRTPSENKIIYDLYANLHYYDHWTASVPQLSYSYSNGVWHPIPNVPDPITSFPEYKYRGSGPVDPTGTSGFLYNKSLDLVVVYHYNIGNLWVYRGATGHCLVNRQLPPTTLDQQYGYSYCLNDQTNDLQLTDNGILRSHIPEGESRAWLGLETQMQVIGGTINDVNYIEYDINSLAITKGYVLPDFTGFGHLYTNDDKCFRSVGLQFGTTSSFVLYDIYNKTSIVFWTEDHGLTAPLVQQVMYVPSTDTYHVYGYTYVKIIKASDYSIVTTINLPTHSNAIYDDFTKLVFMEVETDDNVDNGYFSRHMVAFNPVDYTPVYTSPIYSLQSYPQRPPAVWPYNVTIEDSLVLNGVYHWKWGGANQSTYTLGQIVADISYRVGLTASQIDVSALTDIVLGYPIGSLITGRNAIEPLSRGYFFDAVESSGVVKFVKRGNDPVVTITNDDIVEDTQQ